ncbi:MAG: DUF262 domain-containing protein [Chloroflexota bacterium]|nr:DUF262 domain-containing protein [Chloroflexota bacterium]
MSVSVTSETDSQFRNPLVEDDTGLEIEQDDTEERIEHPFEPEKVKIRTVNIVVSQMVERIKFEEIDLAPDFQRNRGIWSRERKSRLIESLLLRIPIPVFYVAADRNEVWSVVDGVQRMSTIDEYVTGQFPLERLQYLTQLKGCRHDALTRPLQRRISETQLIVNVIEPGTPDEVMQNVFLRINTGGMRLNGQEIRHALNPGPVRNYLKTLAESNEFIEATDGTIPPKRMDDRECVLRFLAFYIEPPEKYTTSDLDGYLGRTMKRVNNMSAAELSGYEADFRKAMRAAHCIFGEDAFRKPRAEANRRRPVNKALFETWSVSLASCSSKEIEFLIERSKDVKRRLSELMAEDTDFDNAISYSTGLPSRVRKRFQAIEQIIKGFV